jgi:hypothetical protein
MEMMLEQIQRKVKKEAKKERRSEASDYSKVKEGSKCLRVLANLWSIPASQIQITQTYNCSKNYYNLN